MKIVQPFLLLLILGGSLGCTHQPATKAEMEQEFNAEFGFSPPASVTDYQCSVVSMGDTLGTWFTFKCTEEVFEQIRSKGFQSERVSDGKYHAHVWGQDVALGDPNAPKWWPGVPRSDEIFWEEWHSPDRVGHFIYCWRNPTNGRAYSKCGDWR